jgi:ParB-like chromosome segregation protein Spo0J
LFPSHDLKRSFDEIGFAQPININLDNTILSGHARVQQLLKEGVEEVDCYVPDRQLTPKQEEAVIIRMNKNVAGEWDFKMLRDEFNWNDLEDYGFIENELELDIDKDDKEDSEVKINFDFKLEVDCTSEEKQQMLQEELNDRGFKVRVLI